MLKLSRRESLRSGTPRAQKNRARKVGKSSSRKGNKKTVLRQRLAEALEQQTATARILRVINNSAADPQSVLEAIAQSGARLCKADDALIHLREGDVLRHVVHYGRMAAALEIGETKPISRTWSPARAVLEARQFHIRDARGVTDEYPESARLAHQYGYRTVLVTPLMRGRTALGVLVIRRTRVRPFTRKQIELVNTFAQEAVLAIENARMFKEQALIEERRRILADIHDGLGASLLALLAAVKSNGTDQNGLEQRVRHALNELRIAIDALRPVEGDLATVLGNLRQRIQPMIEAASAKLSWDVGELPQVEALDAAAVFSIQRIVLEAIANAVRHSGASNIRLAAYAVANKIIRITIGDDGRGYQPDSTGRGCGLDNMRLRAQKLGGTLDIASTLGVGSTVHLLIPCSGSAAASLRASQLTSVE